MRLGRHRTYLKHSIVPKLIVCTASTGMDVAGEIYVMLMYKCFDFTVFHGPSSPRALGVGLVEIDSTFDSSADLYFGVD